MVVYSIESPTHPIPVGIEIQVFNAHIYNITWESIDQAKYDKLVNRTKDKTPKAVALYELGTSRDKFLYALKKVIDSPKTPMKPE
jgi:hypothetical protein